MSKDTSVNRKFMEFHKSNLSYSLLFKVDEKLLMVDATVTVQSHRGVFY